MTITGWIVSRTIKGLAHLLCRIDAKQLARVPDRGPLILVSNHVNFLDVPVVFTHLQPRPIAGFSKTETWDHPFLGPLFTLYGAIPLRRGEADVTALRKGLDALEAGCILGVAPEGTRSGDGCLQRGHPGVVTIALHSGAPVLPMAVYGFEMFKHNFPRLRRTDFRIVVGNPFYLNVNGTKVTRLVRQQIVDEIMYQMAALLPPAYRGYYSDLAHATETFLRFSDPAQSNLRRVL
jgi:1-acyl-sn-glycerol-3-phosphate acyltransferase